MNGGREMGFHCTKELEVVFTLKTFEVHTLQKVN